MGKLGTRTRSHAHGKRHGRLMLHMLIVGLALIAVAFASQYPKATVATTSTSMPTLAYSGVGGSLAISASEAQLRPGTSLRTLDSVATVTRPTTVEVASVRAAGGVSPAASFTSGVSAAAAASLVDGAGVTSLADIVDPQKPFQLYTTKPGDTVSGIAEAYGIEIGTLLDNNPVAGDGSLIEVGQQLLVPLTDAIMHKVAAGETVSSIVAQYDNIDAATVIAYRPNAVADPENLEAGSYLALPGAKVKPPPPPPEPEPESPDSGGAPPFSGGGPPASGGMFTNPLLGYLRISDHFGVPRGAGRIHTGIDLDLAGYWNSPIFAACDGTVSRVEYLTYSYGYHVVIDCGDGWTTLYAHMSQIDVVVGQYVTQGTNLGRSGLTGFTTGEHLHFEIRRHGTPLNPANYINF